MSRRRLATVILLLAVLIAGLVRVTRVREQTVGPQLLWNSSEAYLVVGLTRLGWRMPAAMIILGFVAPFGLPVTNSDHAVTMFRIGPERVDRYLAEHMNIGIFGAKNGRLSSGVWRWDGEHFERVPSTEGGRVRNDQEFTDVDGWSKRTLPLGNAPSEGWRVPFEIGSQPAALIVGGALSERTTIELERNGGRRERLWSLDEAPRNVSSAEYEGLFKQ